MSLFDGSYERPAGKTIGFGPVLGRVFGASLTTEEIRWREMAAPLRKAQIGAQAVHDGLKKGDDELRLLGAAMVTSALIEVDDATHTVVPPEVADGVNDIAAALPTGTVANNPYISANDANKAALILEDGKPGL